MAEAIKVESVADGEVMEIILEGSCPTISGQSTLTYQVGRKRGDPASALHLRIAANTGRGMFCKDWIPVSAVEEVIASSEQLSGRSFRDIWRGRSTNNGGFLVAILKNLGALRRVSADSHAHEAVAGATVKKAIEARMSEKKPAPSKPPKKGRAPDPAE